MARAGGTRDLVKGSGVGLGLAAGLCLAACLVGCSDSESRPPPLADCPPNDAGCTTQTVSGGGGGGNEDAASVTCSGQDLSEQSQCTQCAGLHCCSELTTCFGNTDCENLFMCLQTFSAAYCDGQYAAGQATYDALESCLGDMCTVCSESGIGDPCGGSNVGCATGLTCTDGWCTVACTATTSCAGLGPNGGNALGLANACIAVVALGDICAPGCTTDSDCANGTFCLQTTTVAGAAVQVCSRPPDAGP